MISANFFLLIIIPSVILISIREGDEDKKERERENWKKFSPLFVREGKNFSIQKRQLHPREVLVFSICCLGFITR